MSLCWIWLISLQSFSCLSCDPPSLETSYSAVEEIFPFQKMGFSGRSLLFLHSSAVTLLKLRSGPLPWAAFWMNLCVHLCVCLCVRPINISALPNSRCLYNTAVLLSSCLSLYLLDCFIEVHSDTLYEAEQERGRCIPKPQHKTSLSMSLSPPA